MAKTIISLDLETLGHTSKSAIVQIGAYAVRLHDEQVMSEFEVDLRYDGPIPKELDVTHSTITWWVNQSEAARATVFGRTLDNMIKWNLGVHMFEEWLKKVAKIEGSNDLYIIAHSFDNEILKHSIELVRGNMDEYPVHYTRWRELRTLVGVFGDMPDDLWYRFEPHHRALSDAKTQMNHILWMHRKAQEKGLKIV